MMMRFYRALLHVLPRAFRDEFGDEMRRALEEHWSVARQTLGTEGRLRFWTRQIVALFRSAVTVRLEARRHSAPVGSAGWQLTLFDDFGSALRSVWRRAGFSALCVSILGIGIGASTAMYSVVGAVLLRPLPFDGAERMVAVREVRSEEGGARAAWGGIGGEIHASHLAVDAWQREQDVVEVVSYSPDESRFAGEDPVVVRSANVSASFFPFLGEPLLIGRSPSPAEVGADAPRTVILSHSVWQNHFGGDPTVLGRTLSLAGRLADEVADYTIVGVAGPRFDFPEGAQLWKTRRAPLDLPVTGLQKTQRVLGRLVPGVTPERAQAELTRIAAALPYNEGWTAEIRPLADVLTSRLRPALAMLAGAVTLLLLIACANVANLMLARGVARREEMAVRASLGGSRGRIARGLLLEGLLLGAAAGAVGILLARAGTVSLVGRLDASSLPRFLHIGVDGSALAFAVVVSLVTGIIAGTIPALHAAANLTPALREGRQISGGRRHFRSGLVVAEVALSTVLLAGAGVFLRSLLAVLSVNPGFHAEQLTAFEVRMTSAVVADNAQRWFFAEDLAERVRSLPTVVAAATTRNLPMTGRGEPNPVRIEDREVDPSAPPAQTTSVSPGYFATMGIEVTSGRDFERADATRGVAIVSETFVRTFFPDEDPIGRRVGRTFGGNNFFEIVGVAGDVHQTGLMDAPEPMLYTLSSQDATSTFQLVVRSSQPLDALVPMVREAARDLDPALLVPLVTPLGDVVSRSASRPRFYAMSVGVFAAVAVALALFGLYAVLSHAVAERKGEVAIRVTLGAAPSAVVALFLRQGLQLAMVGVALGLLGALLATRLLKTLVFGIHHTDIPSLAAAVLLLLAAATLATLIPARAAARVDPGDSLKA